MRPFQTENGSQGDFPKFVYRLLIVQTEVRSFVIVYKEKIEVIHLQTDLPIYE
jgi:hypothetical protein